MYTNKGIFYVVSTPIGNINDISLRALDILKSVDIIYAEDTRVSANLLQHFTIKTPLQSCHSYNEEQKSQVIINQLLEGKNLALISDAGTPLISDPGFLVVQQALQQQIKVVPIPGASAILTAIVGSGINCTKFSFMGFLSSKRQGRFKELEQLKYSTTASIIYEAPHRILDFLQDAAEVFGEDRKLCLARELTKTFETFLTGNAKELLEILHSDSNQQKGEMVVIIEPFLAKAEEANLQNLALAESLLKDLLPYMSPAKASSILAKNLNLNKKAIYNLAMAQKG